MKTEKILRANIDKRVLELKKDSKKMFTSNEFETYLQGKAEEITAGISYWIEDFELIANVEQAREFETNILSNLTVKTTSEAEITAYTAYNTSYGRIDVMINPLNGLVEFYGNENDEETFKNKYFRILGFLYHEMGHVFFTDFRHENHEIKCIQDDLNYFKKYDNFNKNLLIKIQKDLDLRKLVRESAGSISNILEDSYIEWEISNYSSGTGKYSISMINNAHKEILFEAIKNTDTTNTKGLYSWLLNALLRYAKYKTVFEPPVKVSDDYESLKHYADLFRNERNPKKRWLIVVEVICLLSSYMNEILDSAKQKNQSGSGSGSGSGSNSSSGSGSGSSGKEMSKEEIIKALQDMLDSLQNKSREEKRAESQNESKSIYSDNSPMKAKNDNSKSANGNKSGSKQKLSAGGMLKGEPQASSQSEQKGQNDNNSQELSDKSKDSEINNLLSQIAKELENQGKVKEQTDKLNQQAKSIMQGQKKSIKVIRERCPNKYGYIESERIRKKYKTEINKISNQIKEILADRSPRGDKRNCFDGKKLNTSSLTRSDGRYFIKSAAPTKEEKVAFGLLIDMSGSMYGRKMKTARETAIIMRNVLKGLNVPFFIRGHSHRSNTVLMYDFIEFEKSDGKDLWRMGNIDADGDNADGYALQYMYGRLKERSEDRKVLFVISDGQPSASGYYGTRRITHCRNVVKENKDIKTLSFSIDGDIKKIDAIYTPQKNIEVKNLQDLPKDLTKTLKKEILN